MSNVEVGGRTFGVNRILAFLHNMMKNYPLLTAREILWSYFLPNDKAIEDARTKDGKPQTINDVITRVLHSYVDEDGLQYSPSRTPDETPAIYRLKTIGRRKDQTHKEIGRINTIIVIANSHSHARSIASYRSSSYGAAPDYASGKHIWKDACLTSCELVAKIADENIKSGTVLFAGTTA